jgi:nitrate/TMAO reductase-like tetraheme cytochrome c subunit
MNSANPSGSHWRLLSAPLARLSNNPISLVGVVFVTTASVLWLFLLPVFLRGQVPHPYIGILLFLMLPGLFFGGLVLIPLGVWLRYRRERKKGPVAWTEPARWNMADVRRLAAFVAVTTLANLVIGSQFSYRAVSYMDSVTFCGLTCHRIMIPEYTAYQQSPHSRVDCVQCHIGPGASWFVKSKLSGVNQVFNYVLNTYPRPIPTPVESLRPARETCEACHWPERFSGDRLRVINEFGDDEKNSVTTTVLLMHVGGGNGGIGIHGRHVGVGVQIEYASDPSRQNIVWVRHKGADGKVTEFRSADAKPGAEDKLEHRVMDCIDCHNRPSHNYELPERALNEAFGKGLIPVSLPFIHKQGLDILKRPWKSRKEAQAGIPASVTSFYRQYYPSASAADVERAGAALAEVWDRNVYPELRINWGTYPNNLGHADFPGCFRCHDGSHTSSSGDTIVQDCESCHHVLAVEEASPKILADLGVGQ